MASISPTLTPSASPNHILNGLDVLSSKCHMLPPEFKLTSQLNDQSASVHGIPTNVATTTIKPPFSIRSNGRIGCLGAGYVGGSTMATIAQKCPALQVFVTDTDEEKIKNWNRNVIPIFEPGLKDVFSSCHNKNLFFESSLSKVIDLCDILFICVGTPTDYANGKNHDLKAWKLAADLILRHSHHSKIIVEKSTVPVGTAFHLSKLLNQNEQGLEFCVLSNPEFLSEGTAMSDLANPDRVLIGGPDSAAGKFAIQCIINLYATWVPRERILSSNSWSSELAKLASNAFLAQRLSSINTISQICERTGADISDVSQAIGSDHRIGSCFLRASVGFGGSCFQKDILSLIYLCESLELKTCAEYWKCVLTVNEQQKCHFSHTVLSQFQFQIEGKRFAVLGFSFKKNTGDTRGSPASDICAKLLKHSAVLSVYDPKVTRIDALSQLMQNQVDCNLDTNFLSASTPEEAVFGAQAILVLTDWNQFCHYDYSHFFELMIKPAYIFDGHNLLCHTNLKTLGFNVFSIGKCLM